MAVAAVGLCSLARAAQGTFDVRQYGAKGDGRTLDTVAIQSSINAAHAAGGGIVLLPRGVYLTGSLHLKSHVDLRIEAGATLLGSTSRSDYQKGRWYALLIADNQEDIAISGSGTIDGQGRELVRDIIRRIQSGELADPMRGNRPDEKQRPLIIEFHNCRRVKVTGVTVRNSSCWVQNYIDCEDLAIDHIRVESTAYWNNDGIDIYDCKRVRIANVDINAADDGICLKSGKAAGGCEDVEVVNCRVRSSASAFKCGTSSGTAFQKIRVHGLQVYDTYRSAIALETVDGAVLRDVRIEDVRATNTGNAIFLRIGRRNDAAPPGRLEDVVIRDVRVEVPAGKPDEGYEIAGPPLRHPHNTFPASIVGLPGHPVRNVVLEDMEIVYPGGNQPDVPRVAVPELGRVPELESAYPEFSMFGELPAWAFYVRHAEGLEFRNVRVRLQSADYRPACVFDDVRGLLLQGVQTTGDGAAPSIVLNRVSEEKLVGMGDGTKASLKVQVTTY
jgi:polygalacturonase